MTTMITKALFRPSDHSFDLVKNDSFDLVKLYLCDLI